MEKTMYDSAVSRLYDYEQENFTRDIPFYVEYARKCRGEVLELACGTGRILIPIAKKSIRITGLDKSKHMLGIARTKINRLPSRTREKVILAYGDMKNFEFRKKFALVIVAFRSFQAMLTKKDQGECLECIHRHLRKNGLLIIDLFAPNHDYLAKNRLTIYLGKIHDKENDVEITRRVEASYDLAAQTVKNDWFYEWTDKKGAFRRHIWSFELAYLFRYEAELLLEKHGFKVEKVYGNFDKSPYNYFSGEQIFVARKTGKIGDSP